jgi:ribosomal protein S27E
MGEPMSGEIGNENTYVRITCPHCRKQFQKTAAWISAHDYVRCDFCKQPLGLNAYKGKTATAEAPEKGTAALTKRPKPKR